MEKFNVSLKRDRSEEQETDRVVILIDDEEYVINKGKFGGLEIRKTDGQICIFPQVSNSILIK